MSTSIIDEILSRPEAPRLAEKLNKLLAHEQEKRKQFYATITDQEKAEFINGEIVLHSPATMNHGDILSRVANIIQMHVKTNQLGWVGVEKMMIRLTRNDYEPDLIFFNNEKASTFKPNQLLFPTPDFIVEILSASTEKRDRGVKFNDYEAHQVKEFWLIDPESRFIEQYLLKNQSYQLQVKLKNGFIEAEQIKGLKINVEAFFDDQLNLEEIKKILAAQ